MTAYVRSHEIVERLKLAMPAHLTLIDPMSGESFEIHRDNYLSMLVIDSHNLLFEGQPLPALYAEAGRACRAAEYAHDLAEVRYKRWKAQRAAEFRDKRKEGKGPTVAEVEEFYRCHEQYEAMAMDPKRWSAIAGLLEDVRDAFGIKQRIQHDQTALLGAYERVEQVDGEFDRLREMESLEREAEAVMAASDSAAVAAEYARQLGTNKTRKR
jgi:hypothetical protein